MKFQYSKIVTYYAKKICEKSKTSSYICRYILFVCSIIFYFRKQKVTQFLKQEHEQWAQIRYRFFFRENNTSSDIQNEYTNRVLYFCQKKGYFSYIILCFFIINIPFIFKIIHRHFRIQKSLKLIFFYQKLTQIDEEEVLI